MGEGEVGKSRGQLVCVSMLHRYWGSVIPAEMKEEIRDERKTSLTQLLKVMDKLQA